MENKQQINTILQNDIFDFFIKSFPNQSFIMVHGLRKALKKYLEGGIIK